MGPNSTSVMPGIEMERAFSALASPVRLPRPLGWAGMMGAFGAPRFAGDIAMPQDANPKCPISRLRSARRGCGADNLVYPTPPLNTYSSLGFHPVVNCRDLHFQSLMINYPHARAFSHDLSGDALGWLRQTTGIRSFPCGAQDRPRRAPRGSPTRRIPDRTAGGSTRRGSNDGDPR